MKKSLTAIAFVFSIALSAQESSEKTTFTFKDTRVVNGQSIETNQEGQLKFLISHRFGNVLEGYENFFGLDEANIRLGLDYGIFDFLTVGIGRSSQEKTVDGFIKAKALQQTKDNKIPLSVTFLASTAIRTLDLSTPDREYPESSKYAYTYQALLARKFSDRLSIQLMPTFVHRNLVSTREEENDLLAVGAASRFQLTKTVSFQTEYYYNLPDQLPERFNNSLSLGFDIETKGHVFQLHISNSRGMIEKFFIGETRGQWEYAANGGALFYGFNISRNFQLKSRDYK